MNGINLLACSNSRFIWFVFMFVLFCVYLAMLAQSLVADNCILPKLQLFINEESWTHAAEIC